MIEFQGTCATCLAPICKTILDPLRYPADEWHGEDIVYCEFLSSIMYSPKAFALLRQFERRIERTSPVLFEG